MKTQEEQQIKLRFPFSLYFQQLFCPDAYVKFINPFGFWRRYRIKHLETCWDINIVRYLEQCHQIEWQLVRSHLDNKPNKNPIQTGIYRGLPWKKTPQNTILISQPSFELKYRGVTYITSGIVAVNNNKVETKTSQVTLDGSEKFLLLTTVIIPKNRVKFKSKSK